MATNEGRASRRATTAPRARTEPTGTRPAERGSLQWAPAPQAPAWDAAEEEPPAAVRPTPASTRADTERGLPWASTLGWVAASAGLLLSLYALLWAVQNWPNNFNPGGVSGLISGVVFSMAGVAAGVVFLFVPRARAARFEADRARLEASYFAKVSQAFSYTGVGLLMAGLALATWTYRAYVLAGGPSAGAAPWLSDALTYPQWATAFLAVAGVGLLFWTAFGARAAAYRFAARAAGQGAPRPAGAPLSGLAGEEVVALVRRLDSMLAMLPEETVAAFSKSPEAETYLKILGGRKGEGARSTGGTGAA